MTVDTAEAVPDADVQTALRRLRDAGASRVAGAAIDAGATRFAFRIAADGVEEARRLAVQMVTAALGTRPGRSDGLRPPAALRLG